MAAIKKNDAVVLVDGGPQVMGVLDIVQNVAQCWFSDTENITRTPYNGTVVKARVVDYPVSWLRRATLDEVQRQHDRDVRNIRRYNPHVVLGRRPTKLPT